MDFDDLDDYLNVEQTDTPKEILEKFMSNIPFENITVQNGRSVSLETKDLLEKVVQYKRGGFCYELNVLFNRYLASKGYDVNYLSATIKTPKGWTREGTHMTNILYYNGERYITDVGFGDLPLTPLLIGNYESEARIINDVRGEYRAFEKDDMIYVQKKSNDVFQTKYKATDTKRSLEEFSPHIYYNQFNKHSVFVKNLIVTLPTDTGRVSLSQNNLTITSNGASQKIPVTKDNYRRLLKRYFGMDVIINRLET